MIGLTSSVFLRSNARHVISSLNFSAPQFNSLAIESTNIFGVILSLLMGASAQSSISYIIDGLGWANSGAILTLLYFSPIKKEFDK